MTHRQFMRLRKWDKRTAPAYRAGLMDGHDLRYTGYERPIPLVGVDDDTYDTSFYIRPIMRHAQAISNAALARSRGRVDGWDLADREMAKAENDDWIERQVIHGLEQMQAYLRLRAA